MESINPSAYRPKEAASGGGDQGKYGEMHTRLLGNQNGWGLTELPQHAQALGLDLPRFQQCLDSGKHAGKIRSDLADGQKAGVQGTPTFFLGLTEPNDPKVKAVRIIRGAQPYTRSEERRVGKE